VGRPQLEELGIQLDVTPSVGADMRTVSLKLTPEISEFVRYESYEVSDGGGVNRGLLSTNGAASVTNNTAGTSLLRLPIFRRSKLETEVLVQSGETIVMGGLISSTESRSEKRVPFLSAIPLIGRFFRHDETEEIKQNLLIFVTATILSDRGIELVPVASR
jgi:type IV pilus assembly protein PilQ